MLTVAERSGTLDSSCGDLAWNIGLGRDAEREITGPKASIVSIIQIIDGDRSMYALGGRTGEGEPSCMANDGGSTGSAAIESYVLDRTAAGRAPAPGGDRGDDTISLITSSETGVLVCRLEIVRDCASSSAGGWISGNRSGPASRDALEAKNMGRLGVCRTEVCDGQFLACTGGGRAYIWVLLVFSRWRLLTVQNLVTSAMMMQRATTARTRPTMRPTDILQKRLDVEGRGKL